MDPILDDLRRRLGEEALAWEPVADWARRAYREIPSESFPVPGPLNAPVQRLSEILFLSRFPGDPEAYLCWSGPEDCFGHATFKHGDTSLDWGPEFLELGARWFDLGLTAPPRLLAWGVEECRAYSVSAVSPSSGLPLMHGSLGGRLRALVALARDFAPFEDQGLLDLGFGPENVRLDASGFILLRTGENAAVTVDGFFPRIARSGPMSNPLHLLRCPPGFLERGERSMGEDLYTFGIVMFEIAMGRQPVVGGKVIDRIRQSIGPENERRWNWRGFPGAIEDLCRRMTARKRKNRPGSLTDFADELSTIIATGDPEGGA